MNGGKRPKRPPNLAAHALFKPRFRSQRVKSAKIYSRKIKHKKGADHRIGSLF